MNKLFDVVVCGHLCLDLLPQMNHLPLNVLSSPGQLFEVGNLQLSTGGAVSNTGLALHRLGVDVRLMAKVGDDFIGRATLDFLRTRDSVLIEALKVDPSQGSAYTIVLEPEHVDRIFLHCTGPNQTFSSSDIDFDIVAQARLFHLGYPTLLPHFLEDEGRELSNLFYQVQQRGVITSMDMTLPDPDGVGGKVDWQRFLQRVLPYVDIFVPSLDEALFMLRRADYDRFKESFVVREKRDYIHSLADELLALGDCALIGFKLGEAGLYLRSNRQMRLSSLMQKIDITTWTQKEVWQPAFEVSVSGTTGAGDAAYAGLIAALLRGGSIEDAARMAAAVGACCVEAPDATSGIQTWEATQQRINQGWLTLSD